jgi:hypothetical protein
MIRMPFGRARFWTKVVVGTPEQCWSWIASTAGLPGKRYGHLTLRRISAKAHRVSWELANGPIPEGAWVLHRCDNGLCVNPEHLFLGDALANNRDMIAKGRYRGLALRGERHRNAKLTRAQVDAIRTAPGLQKDIAARFGVTQSCVSRLAKGGQVMRRAGGALDVRRAPLASGCARLVVALAIVASATRTSLDGAAIHASLVASATRTSETTRALGIGRDPAQSLAASAPAPDLTSISPAASAPAAARDAVSLEGASDAR